MSRCKDKFLGCLLGGAIGDALGWPVEYKSKGEIFAIHGINGVRQLEINGTGKAFISDDTQMTLFTAEGILFSDTKEKAIDNIYLAYLRWLRTQGYNVPVVEEGWLINDQRLYSKRTPGNISVSSLNSGLVGSLEKAINTSKGCGGTVRVSPVGMVCPPYDAFKIGSMTSAITHGHPTAHISSGAYSMLISLLQDGVELEDSIDRIILYLREIEGSNETRAAIELAKRLFDLDYPSQDAFMLLGAGWNGDEALGISIYSSLVSKGDFKKGLFTAVNHDGNSDGTGTMTGSILGTILGASKLPEEWGYRIEIRDLIIFFAERLYTKYINYNS